MLSAITAGPSLPPVVAETVMSDTNVLGVRDREVGSVSSF